VSADVLRRRDPEGFFVIPARREALEVLARFREGLIIEDAGSLILVKTRSRSLASKIYRRLAARNMIAVP